MTLPMDELRIQVAIIKQRMDEHERRHDDFMGRTDEKLDKLLQESSEWSGARKMMAALVTVITIVGAVIGFMVHEFWPEGFWGKH